MTFVCICSEEYLGYYNILYQSLKMFSPESKQILYFIGTNIPKQFDEVIDITDWFFKCEHKYNELTRICSLRARVVLDAFTKGNDKVVFLGAKVQFFDNPSLIEEMLEEHNAFVTPHILEPLPEDGKFPSNTSVSWTGHISTDVVAFKDTPQVRKFLEWQDEVMKTQCNTTSQTYLDQSWLNFLPFFVDNVYISRDEGYNVAYWNYVQRNLQFNGRKWIVGDGHYLICFQFSGLDLENPEQISTHQNRYKANGYFLNFLSTYAKRVKEYK